MGNQRPAVIFFISFVLCFVSQAIIITEGRSLEAYNERNVMKYYGGGPVPAKGDVESQFVVPQNEARTKVGDPPLVWDDKVASYAQWWAGERKSDCALQHSHGPYGENIFWGGGSDWQPQDAVGAWVGEDKYFNYHTHSCDGFEECGHYTQIVWKHSLRVGCARVICNSGDTFMTCNYDPPGNYVGEKPY